MAPAYKNLTAVTVRGKGPISYESIDSILYSTAVLDYVIVLLMSMTSWLRDCYGQQHGPTWERDAGRTARGHI
jgi:hypothetical protein